MKFSPLLALILAACGPVATRERAVAIAYEYSKVEWMPTTANVRHGLDSAGTRVDTPDRKLASPGGWWRPGVPATGLPYQWGGFDTPESFRRKIAAGLKAGDIATSAKRKAGDAGTSAEACGIDCSGLISRCWNLPRPVSTAALPEICDPLASWDDLQPGDIALSDKHVVLFVKWRVPGKHFSAYEASPKPVWRVNACGLSVVKLKALGYAPWRYRRIR